MNISGLFMALFLLSCQVDKKKSITTQNSDQEKTQFVFSSDVDHFWEAYDSLQKNPNKAEHLSIINSLFLDRGTPGQAAIMQARRYQPEEYVSAMNNYPKLWASIRSNTQKVNDLEGSIEDGIQRLRNLYPDLKPAEVYFSVGVFRTGGTTMGNKVLIGTETAFGDKHVDVSELPDSLNNIRAFWAGKEDATQHFALNNIHEFVHTQQSQNLEANLLSVVLLEGIAEFVSSLAMDLNQSPQPAIAYGKANMEVVRAAFEEDMFDYNYGFWVWSDANNKFQTRDLGYYIGYAMAERYYKAATDKSAAIKEMIELDHFDRAEIEAFVDKTGFLSASVADLRKKQHE